MTGYRAAGAAARASPVATRTATPQAPRRPRPDTSTAFRTRPGALSPESWTADRDRCRAVRIGDDAELATQTRVGAEHDRTRATRRCGSRGSPWTRPTGR
nr:hypothetical protein PDK3.086 [Rhodococcus sp. DK17]